MQLFPCNIRTQQTHKIPWTNTTPSPEIDINQEEHPPVEPYVEDDAKEDGFEGDDEYEEGDEEEQPWLEDLFDIQMEENDVLNFEEDEDGDLPDAFMSSDDDDHCGNNSSSENPFPEDWILVEIGFDDLL